MSTFNEEWYCCCRGRGRGFPPSVALGLSWVQQATRSSGCWVVAESYTALLICSSSPAQLFLLGSWNLPVQLVPFTNDTLKDRLNLNISTNIKLSGHRVSVIDLSWVQTSSWILSFFTASLRYIFRAISKLITNCINFRSTPAPWQA